MNDSTELIVLEQLPRQNHEADPVLLLLAFLVLHVAAFVWLSGIRRRMEALEKRVEELELESSPTQPRGEL